MIIVVLVIAFKAFSGGGTTTIPVYTDQVSTGDIASELSVSGKVVAEESVTFFAPANAKIEGIEVSKGDVAVDGRCAVMF